MTNAHHKPLWKKMASPVGAGLKRYLPNLCKAALGIRDELNRAPALKARTKRLAGMAFFLDVLELALIVIPAKLVSKSPGIRDNLARVDRESQNFGMLAPRTIWAIIKAIPKIKFTADMKKELAIVFTEGGRQMAALTGGLMDIRLFNALAQINRIRIERSLGDIADDDSEDKPKGIISNAMRTANDISVGLREDPALRRKFIGLAALEIASDVADAKLGVGRHIPALIASLIVSQTIGLKGLDLSARAVELGVSAKHRDKGDEDKIVDLPSLHLLNVLGMKTQSAEIARNVNAHPKIKGALMIAASATRIGMGFMLTFGTNYIARLVVNPLSSVTALERVLIKGGAGAMVAGIGGTSALLAFSYMRGRRAGLAPE